MDEKKKTRRIPSVAVIVTLLIGLAFTLFSVAESILGFLQKPVDLSAGVGGLMQIAMFGLPFFIIAWILWIKPKLGAILLILAGLGFGFFLFFHFNNPDWIVASLLVGVPIVLGVITLIWPGKPVTRKTPIDA
jgi:hypothetical protein